MPQNRKNSESGNVFFMILIGVFLFGALMYSFSRSGSDGVSSISKQQAKVAAQEILNYARLVEGAVDRVRRNGCSENEISFENAVVAGYSNTNSPADKSCHVFEAKGGKVSYSPPNRQWLDKTKTSVNSYGRWVFNGQARVNNLGKICGCCQCAEIISYLPFLRKEICDQINNISGFDSSYIEESILNVNYSSSGHFKGTFINSGGGLIGNEAPELSNQPSACIYRSYNTHYTFYHAVLVR